MAKSRKAPVPMVDEGPVAAPAKKRELLPDDLTQEVTGVALAAAGLWSLFALGGSGGGYLGNHLKAGLLALFGQPGAWVVPLFLIFLGGYMVYLRRGFRLQWRHLGWATLLLVLMGASEVWHHPGAGQADWEKETLQGIGGGVIGYGLIYVIQGLLGSVARYIVLVFMAWAGFLMATHISVADFLRVFVKAGLVVSGRWKARATRHLAEAKRQRAIDRMANAAADELGGPEVIVSPGKTDNPGPRILVVPPGTKPLIEGEYKDARTGKPVGSVGAAAYAATPAKPLVEDWVLGGEDDTAQPTATREPVVSQVRMPASPPPADVPERTPRRSEEPRVAPVAPVAPATPAAVVIHRPEPAPAPAAIARQPEPAPPEVDEPKIVIAEPTPRPDKQKVVTAAQLSLGDQLGRPYQLPPLALLPLSEQGPGDSAESIRERIVLLEHTLETFGVKAKVTEVHVGPAITRFELQPAPGVRVNKITALADDLALNLAAEDVRIQAPIPGKAAIGIEVPNRERAAVRLRDVLESPEYKSSSSRLTVGLGKDIAGKPIIGDLGKMPHVLIAGSTGSGKSVCMNTLIASILFKARPDEVKILMIDPKRVELAVYEGIPHLAAPVVTDPRKAAGFLKWAVKEMEVRYDLFASSGVRDITRYNQLVLEDPGPDPEHPRKPLPYIVIFIDELADLMMVAPADVEDAICRLAQMARACGMHLVVATQRPSVDVITGLIKANIPSRIAFAVSSQIDSRTILDGAGAEKLLGRGDMLYSPVGASHAVRAQGAFIDEKEVEKIVTFAKKQGQPEQVAEPVDVPLAQEKGAEKEKDPDADPVFGEAVRVVIEHGQASVSILQRRLRLNYTKAARLIDDMEQAGFIGPHQGPKPREVLISMGQWEQRFGSGRGQVEAETAAEGEALDDE